jgi:hypothetical protein
LQGHFNILGLRVKLFLEKCPKREVSSDRRGLKRQGPLYIVKRSNKEPCRRKESYTILKGMLDQNETFWATRLEYMYMYI